MSMSLKASNILAGYESLIWAKALTFWKHEAVNEAEAFSKHEADVEAEAHVLPR